MALHQQVDHQKRSLEKLVGNRRSVLDTRRRDQRKRVGCRAERGMRLRSPPFPHIWTWGFRRGRPERSRARGFCAFIGAKYREAVFEREVLGVFREDGAINALKRTVVTHKYAQADGAGQPKSLVVCTSDPDAGPHGAGLRQHPGQQGRREDRVQQGRRRAAYVPHHRKDRERLVILRAARVKRWRECWLADGSFRHRRHFRRFLNLPSFALKKGRDISN
jgi:hypothetical protein